MEPTNIRFGGGATGTILHPVVAVALVIAAVLILLLPRRQVVIPWLSAALLIPFAQVVVLGGVHLTVYRILVIVALARLAVPRSPTRLGSGFNSIDGAFAVYALYSFAAFSFQWMETAAVVKALGSLLDALGGYFVLRFLIQDREDVHRAIKALAVVAAVVAVCMANEQITHTNVFGLLGGMPVDVVMRDGRARSTGSFEVYITAGVFGATLIPLFVWLWSSAKARLAALSGMFAATVITVTSSSSTPLLAYVGGIGALCCWPLHRRMRALRWGLALVLLTLHLAMNAPVWALIARVDLTGASSGYQRYLLVDECISHFGDWWLAGFKDYNNWGFDMWDLSNQYVAIALTGGLVALVAFILVISRSFGRLGTARKLVEGDRRREWSLWCLGAALFSHVVAYLGICYFDQVQVAWYALLAMICATAFEPAAGSRTYEVFTSDEAPAVIE